MTMTPKTQDLKILNRLYNEEIDKFETNLDELDFTFNYLCEEIRTTSHSRLNALPKSDQIGREQVLIEEKKELDQVLRELKTAIKKRSQEMRNALENIQIQKDAVAPGSENELNA